MTLSPRTPRKGLRKTALKRSRMKPKKRKPSEFARIYGSKARVEWVKSLPCAACAIRGYSQNAHTESGGMGRKADYTTIVPLCGPHDGVQGCHADYDQHCLPFDHPAHRAKAVECAAYVQARWLRSQEGA